MLPSPIRVARVIARLNVGGPAQHVIHLTGRLPRDRFESVLLAGREGPAEGNMRDLAARSAVQPIAVPGLGRPLSPVDDVRSLAAILIQADRFGSSIAQALRVQSDSMRTRRRQLAEEKAAKTAVQLIFPLVLFIFPALFVVLVGPAAIPIQKNLLKG